MNLSKKNKFILPILIILILAGIIFSAIFFTQQAIYGGVPFVSKELISSTQGNSMEGNVNNMEERENKLVCTAEIKDCSANYCGCRPDCLVFDPMALTDTQKENYLGIRILDFKKDNEETTNIGRKYMGLWKNVELEKREIISSIREEYTYTYTKPILSLPSNFNGDTTKLYSPSEITLLDLQNGFSICGANRDTKSSERADIIYSQAFVDIEVECFEDSDCGSFEEINFVCSNNLCIVSNGEQAGEETETTQTGNEEDNEIIITGTPKEEGMNWGLLIGGIIIFIGFIIFLIIMVRGKKK